MSGPFGFPPSPPPITWSCRLECNTPSEPGLDFRRFHGVGLEVDDAAEWTRRDDQRIGADHLLRT